TRESVERKCQQILHRQHLRQLVQTTVILNAAAVPQLSYQSDPPAQEKLRDTYLGKTLLITGHQEWSDVQVIRAYRSQFVIEEIFHEMKDRHIGAWWPLHHWTDSKIQVHGLYCTIAVLLRALLWRRARQAGLRFSANRSSISANRLGVLAATAALGAAPQSCNTSRGLGSCCLSSGAAATRRQCGGLSSREKFPRSRTGSDTPE